MVEQVRLDPDSVAAAGRELAGRAQQMIDENAALENAVAGSGSPWGGDEAGSVFGLAYQAVVGEAFEAFASYTEQVGFAAATLVMQARSAAETDDANAASLYGGPPS
ncbi:hypothetical protein OHA21_50640 [Actinoplanes sp. NBC_00393]|uniref:WXG100 family type VII secretion target n=1 Tax=Actinoplanes sp. NBC_00393 TaxID=2975953 RepID=UPI002E20EBCC